MELGFQRTTHNFFQNFVFFLVVSIILPAHPCQGTAFFACNCSSNPCELLGLYLSGEVRWNSPWSYKSSQVLKLLKLRILCKLGTTFAVNSHRTCLHSSAFLCPWEGKSGARRRLDRFLILITRGLWATMSMWPWQNSRLRDMAPQIQGERIWRKFAWFHILRVWR